MTTQFKKNQDIQARLNAALLRKELLTDQLNEVSEEVKALRNVVAGIQMGSQAIAEIQAMAAQQNSKSDPNAKSDKP